MRRRDIAFWHLADINQRRYFGRFRGNRGHAGSGPKATLLTHRRHRLLPFRLGRFNRYDDLSLGGQMKRREFIMLLGGAATASPFGALAQQRMPLVGFLNSASPDTYRFNADSFREGLTKAGFIENRNVRIEERWARGDYGALPALAAELV